MTAQTSQVVLVRGLNGVSSSLRRKSNSAVGPKLAVSLRDVVYTLEQRACIHEEAQGCLSPRIYETDDGMALIGRLGLEFGRLGLSVDDLLKGDTIP